MLAVVHPFPSALQALVVFSLVLLTRSGTSVLLMPAPDLRLAAILATAMLLTHFSIGAANDWADADADRLTKPAKPIPAGLITRRDAAFVAIAAGGGALLLAALAPGVRQPATFVLLALTLAVGLAYDFYLKPTALSWLPFAIAFVISPVYSWFGPTGELPPRAELLLPVAFVAGPMLQLANGLVDLERDETTGSQGLVGRLGRRWAWRVMALLQLLVNALAWLTIGATALQNPSATLVLLVAASVLSALGVLLSTGRPEAREWGWRCQALGLAVLAVCWLVATAGPG